MNSTTRLAFALIAVGTSVLAHSGVQNADVLARMEGMSAMTSEVRTLGDMAKGARAFDAGDVEDALDTLSVEAGRIQALFQAEEMDPKSEALPDIWDDFDSFADLGADLSDAISEVQGSIETRNDLTPALRKIGAACRACHGQFRE